MAQYYNVTRGPLAASLSSGRSVTIPPKAWFEVDAGDEGSASVNALVRKGFLKKSVLPPEPEPVVPIISGVREPVAVVPTLVQEIVVDPDLVVLPKSEAKAEEAEAEAKKK